MIQGLHPHSFGSYDSWLSYTRMSLQQKTEQAPWADYYQYMLAHWLENDMYELLDSVLQSVELPLSEDDTQPQPLRNPAKRIVEFYGSLLWPGTCDETFQMKTEVAGLEDAVKKIWIEGKWDIAKAEAARTGPIFGDTFYRVETNSDNPGQRPSKVFFKSLFPPFINDISWQSDDELDFFRMDIPEASRNYDTGEQKPYIYTEVWDIKNGGRIWEHEKGPEAPLKSLGEPKMQIPLHTLGLTKRLPVIHQCWRSMGPGRGYNAFSNSLTKLHELDRMVSRLHDILFRYKEPIQGALSDFMDSDGRELPPPQLGNAVDEIQHQSGLNLVNLYGVREIVDLVGNTNLIQHMEAIRSLEKALISDHPELVFWQLHDGAEMGVISGQAIYYRLWGARMKLHEQRAYAHAGLIRAQKRTLTVRNHYGLSSLSGTEDDWEHSFLYQPIFELSEVEKGQAAQSYAAGNVPFEAFLPRLGWDVPEVEKAVTVERRKQQQEVESVAEGLMKQRAMMNNGDKPRE